MMAITVNPNIIEIWKTYIRMRNSFLYNFHRSKKIIALTNGVEDASECAAFNTSMNGQTKRVRINLYPIVALYYVFIE